MFLNLLEKPAPIEDVAKNFLYPAGDRHNVIQMEPTNVVLNGVSVALTQNIVIVRNVWITTGPMLRVFDYHF